MVKSPEAGSHRESFAEQSEKILELKRANNDVAATYTFLLLAFYNKNKRSMG